VPCSLHQRDTAAADGTAAERTPRAPHTHPAAAAPVPALRARHRGLFHQAGPRAARPAAARLGAGGVSFLIGLLYLAHRCLVELCAGLAFVQHTYNQQQYIISSANNQTLIKTNLRIKRQPTPNTFTYTKQGAVWRSPFARRSPTSTATRCARAGAAGRSVGVAGRC